MDARSERVVPPVRMARMTRGSRETPLFTFAEAGGIDTWTVASGALGKGGSRWLPVRQPGPIHRRRVPHPGPRAGDRSARRRSA